MKRYVHEKIAFIQAHRPQDEHVFIIPGAKDALVRQNRSSIYTIASPLVSRSTQYRALLNLRALSELIERERPDIIESGDPYQVGWKALRIGAALRIPVVAFYHSHFAEAYLRKPIEHSLGRKAAATAMGLAQTYVRKFYNRFAVTLVPSEGLAEELRTWGVRNARKMELGVNTNVFSAALKRNRTEVTRLLYVGRLASEKNTQTLFEAYLALVRHNPGRYHLVVIGDGQQRPQMNELLAQTKAVTWIPYCADANDLARYYGEADLFVHPGVEETFGLVALESQACGTPVVGIRGSYMDEAILHDQVAWAETNSASALVGAIDKMAATDLHSLGQLAAARVAERFAWPRVFERLFSVYQEVVASYRKPVENR